MVMNWTRKVTMRKTEIEEIKIYFGDNIDKIVIDHLCRVRSVKGSCH